MSGRVVLTAAEAANTTIPVQTGPLAHFLPVVTVAGSSSEVMTPDEILALSPRVCSTFIPGMRPVATQLLRYYEEKNLLRGSLLGSVFVALQTFARSLVLVLAATVAYAATRFLQEGW